jgi:hypothetical protein
MNPLEIHIGTRNQPETTISVSKSADISQIRGVALFPLEKGFGDKKQDCHRVRKAADSRFISDSPAQDQSCG